MARVRLASIALVLTHFAVAMLVVGSIVEASQTIGEVFHATRSVNGIFLAAALAAALIPAGSVIVWGGNALAVQLERPFKWVRQYFA